LRPISVGYPSMTAKLTLWAGTENEEKFTIKGINKKPYVKAYGIRYELTPQEVRMMHNMMDIFKKGG